MDSDTLRILQDGYDELNHKAGIGPEAEQQVADAMTILLAGHGVTPEEFKAALWDRMHNEYPHGVMLRFKTIQDKDVFMGQLSDGWGEDHVGLSWPYEAGMKFNQAAAFGVDLWDEDEETER